MSLIEDENITVHEFVDIICDELQVLNPMLYDVPDYSCFVNIDIILDTHTVISVNGLTSGCTDVSIYHNMNNYIREPRIKEREKKWFSYCSSIYYDEHLIFSDSNMICEINISKKSQIDDTIRVIKEKIESIGYNLYDTEYVLK